LRPRSVISFSAREPGTERRVRDPTHAGHARPPWTTAIRGQFAERARRRMQGRHLAVHERSAAYAESLRPLRHQGPLARSEDSSRAIGMSPKRLPILGTVQGRKRSPRLTTRPSTNSVSTARNGLHRVAGCRSRSDSSGVNGVAATWSVVNCVLPRGHSFDVIENKHVERGSVGAAGGYPLGSLPTRNG
jgi:hypothetical protein